MLAAGGLNEAKHDQSTKPKACHQYNIRLALPGDVPALFAISTRVRENHLSLAQLAKLGITPETLPAMLIYLSGDWVVEESGKIVAFLMANAQEPTVFALFVHPEHEGQGIGRGRPCWFVFFFKAGDCDLVDSKINKTGASLRRRGVGGIRAWTKGLASTDFLREKCFCALSKTFSLPLFMGIP